jgi:hypothetical protein
MAIISIINERPKIITLLIAMGLLVIYMPTLI